MDREDIIETAREAGFITAEADAAYEQLADFAELVASAEQDRILRIVYEQLTPYGKTGECAWIGVKHNVRKKE